MAKYIAPRKTIQLTDSITGDSFLLEDGSYGMSLAAIGETVGMSSKSIGSLLTKNDPKALTCKGFLCEDVPIEGSNKPATLAKSPGVALLWLMVAESTRIAQAKRDRAVSLLAAFTADKLEDIHSHVWGKVRMHQESLEYRTETQRCIETALGLYHIWADILEYSKSSATLPKTWSGKPSSKGLPGITLTEDMWKVLSFYNEPYLVKVPGKKYAQEMTYDQAKAKGLLDQPVGDIPYYHLKEALKYTIQQLTLDDRAKNIPKKYWSHGLLAPLFQDAEGFDKAKAAASKRVAKQAQIDIIEDEILASVDEPLAAKELRQLAVKELKRLEATKAAEDRLKRLREDYCFGYDDEQLRKDYCFGYDDEQLRKDYCFGDDEEWL